MSMLQEKPSKENMKHFKTRNFVTFSIFVGPFSLLQIQPTKLREYRGRDNREDGGKLNAPFTKGIRQGENKMVLRRPQKISIKWI
jgi:hypothetical protein